MWRRLVAVSVALCCAVGHGEELCRLDESYSATVGGPNGSEATSFTFHVVRVWTESQAAVRGFPVLVVVREIRSVLSWQLPYLSQENNTYRAAARTLCPLEDENGTLTVELSSASAAPVNVTLNASLVARPHFGVQLDSPVEAAVGPSTPAYFRFDFPPGIDSVSLEVGGLDRICATVSIQPIKCPVFDQDTNVKFVGSFQSMTKRAAFTLTRGEHGDAFYVVLVVEGDDRECGGFTTIYDPTKGALRREKHMRVVVSASVSEQRVWVALGVSAAVIVGLASVAALVSALFDARDRHYLQRELEKLQKLEASGDLKQASPEGRYGALDAGVSADLASAVRSAPAVLGPFVPAEQTPLLAPEDGPSTSVNGAPITAEPRHASASPLQNSVQEDYDTLPDAQVLKVDKAVIRAKRDLRVSDLARKSYKQRDKKYRLYHWNLTTLSVFYVLPVVQLVLAYQAAVYKSGNQDLCFYNFLCSTPLFGLFAFNAVVSNVGYVSLGLLFLVLVRRRHSAYKRLRELLPEGVGLPRHFGLFYAIGLSLGMEGVLSGCYHVCPSFSNFQFDTAFMYMLSALGTLTVYQMRHPDINASSHVAYAAMAGLILISVIGVLGNGVAFWVVFSIVYVVMIVLLAAQFYYKGQWKIGRGFYQRLAQDWRGSCPPGGRILTVCLPSYPDRLVFLILGILLNLVFLSLGLVNMPRNFSSWLLTIFISNLLLYVLYYLAMKVRVGERLGARSLVCLGLGGAAWATALFFFFSAPTDWTKSAALSRESNQKCVLLDFYDSHDVWHFVSALSLFLSFLLLLVVDDDLYFTPAKDIPVF